MDLPRRAGEPDVTALVITVYGTPAPQGSKRGFVSKNGRVSMVESSAKVKPWREAVKYAVWQHAQDTDADRLAPMLTGPVEVGVTFYLPRPKGHYRTGRNAHLLKDGAPPFPAGKPDLDKLLRSTLDALSEAGVWRDDSQVVRLVRLEKVYGQPGARITVAPADLSEQVGVEDDRCDSDPWSAA